MPKLPSGSLFAAGIAFLSATSAAPAADMPVKALPPAVVLPSWTGFYGGLNAGYSFGYDPYNAVPADLPAVTTPNGAVLGGQAGYNWQLGHALVGVEADAQWADQRSTNCGGPGLCVENTVPETDARIVEQRLKWFTTFRGRFGFVTDTFMVYVTGGGAIAGVQETDAINIDFLQPQITYNKTMYGWVGGFGVETKLYQNWSAKVEYLHLDLGSMSTASELAANGPGGIGFDIVQITQSRVTDNIMRIGFNYHLDAGPHAEASPSSPFAAAYAGAGPTFADRWSGFYIGLNAGYGFGDDPVTQTNSLGFFSFAPSIVAPQGGLAGGQAGYNYQIGHLVLGVETDGQWSHMDDTRGTIGGVADAQSIDWFATARGRIGYAMPSYMIYGTAGAAWAGVHDNIAFEDGSAAANFSHTLMGWTAGLGIEARLFGRWTGKVEYLHLDLGGMSNAFVVDPGTGETFSSHTSVRSDLVRVGLNLQIGP